jgi:predicted ATPase
MLKHEEKRGVYKIPKNIDTLIKPHLSFIANNSFKTSYRVDTFKKRISEKLGVEKTYDFINRNHRAFENISKENIQLKYRINLDFRHGVEDLLRDWENISFMLDLELVKIDKFLISKLSPFKYEEASSGESHLLGSLHGIIANIEDNSMVIIDEPEVSLHPNWQIEYFDFLKPVIDTNKGVNVIISTHSHFLISSLKNNESRITSLRRDSESKLIKIEELDYQTYGWEPERILYKIFGMVTQRNTYFEADLRHLISLISKNDSDVGEVERLYNILKKYILSEKDDPLRVVITRSEKYLKDRNVFESI